MEIISKKEEKGRKASGFTCIDREWSSGQEPCNCRLFEKCGFGRTGVERIVNEKMTLVNYELHV